MICNEHDLSIAMTMCATLHRGQVDKAGNPYMLHPLRVAASGADIDQVVLGLMHDLIEDTAITIDMLRDNYSFSTELLDALDAITKREEESTESYLRRVARNELATLVKFNDFNNNSDPARLALLPESKRLRLKRKYNEARADLVHYIAGERKRRYAHV